MNLRPLTEVLTDVTLREGSQQEVDLRGAASEQKLSLLELLTQAGVPQVEFTAFAPGEWFSDAEELATRSERFAELTSLRALYFNRRGLESLLQYSYLRREGVFHTAATHEYRLKNYRQDGIDQVINRLIKLVSAFTEYNLSFDTLLISTAWGDKAEQPTTAAVLELCGSLMDEAGRQGLPIQSVTLADTSGEASPERITELFSAFSEAWPDLILRAHLHPAHALAQESVLAALDGGVHEWEAAWGGVGGSPFAQAPGGNLDIRWLIKTWNHQGCPHGIDLAVAEKIMEALRGQLQREIIEIDFD